MTLRVVIPLAACSLILLACWVNREQEETPCYLSETEQGPQVQPELPEPSAFAEIRQDTNSSRLLRVQTIGLTGEPLPAIPLLVALDNSTNLIRAQSDRAGWAEFEILEGSQGWLTVNGTIHDTHPDPFWSSETRQLEGSESLIVIELAPCDSAIQVQVTDQHYSPIFEGSIELSGGQTRTQFSGNGPTIFAGLCPGTYRITPTLPAGFRFVAEQSRIIELGENEFESIEFEVDPPGSVRVAIAGEPGQPCRIQLRQLDRGRPPFVSAVAACTGTEFVINSLPVGRYAISCVFPPASTLSAETQEFEIESSEEARVSIELLERLESIRGRVLGPDLAPVSNVRIVAELIFEGRSIAKKVVTSDQGGNFEVVGLGPGPVHWYVDPSSIAGRALAVSGFPDQPRLSDSTGIEVRLEKGVQLLAEILDAPPGFLGPVRIHERGSGAVIIPKLRQTSDRAWLEASNLRVGEYEVIVDTADREFRVSMFIEEDLLDVAFQRSGDGQISLVQNKD